MDSSDNETTVDLFISTGETAVWQRQQQIIDRLDRLESEGVVDHYRVHVWGRRVSLSGPMSETQFHRAATRAIEEFERWAADHDLVLPFEREAVTSEFTGEEFRLVRPPTACVALYEAGDLTAVYPCEIDGEQCSLEEAFVRLEEPTESARLARGVETV